MPARLTRTLIASGVLVLTAPVFGAYRDNFVIPSFRGDANTALSSWENFTVPFGGPNLPDADPSGGGSIQQFEPIGMGGPGGPPIIISSANNLYSGTQVMDVRLFDDAPEDIQEVSLQVAAFGNVFDWDNLELSYTTDDGDEIVTPDAVNELFAEILMIPVPGGGVVPSTNQEYQMVWDLSGVEDVITSYQIRFTATVDNISLDAVELDVRFAPAPGAASALVGGALLALRRRR